MFISASTDQLFSKTCLLFNKQEHILFWINGEALMKLVKFHDEQKLRDLIRNVKNNGMARGPDFLLWSRPIVIVCINKTVRT